MHNETKFWDDLAEKYAAQPIADPDAYQRKLEITKARLQPEHVVLDVGCGTGSLALELSPLVQHVHALDFSKGMIDIANRKKAAANITNVTFHQSILDDSLPFEPGMFDGVCAYNILHLVPDRTETLDRIFDLLKPGGYFISSTACLGESLMPYRPILSVMRWLNKAPPVSVFDVEALSRDIRVAGFERLTTPDVGAKSTIGFIRAFKPA